MTMTKERSALNVVTAGATKTAGAPLLVWRKTSSLSGSQVDQPGAFVSGVGVVITVLYFAMLNEVVDVQYIFCHFVIFICLFIL